MRDLIAHGSGARVLLRAMWLVCVGPVSLQFWELVKGLIARWRVRDVKADFRSWKKKGEEGVERDIESVCEYSACVSRGRGFRLL